MNTVGFPKSTKKNEKRRVILPKHIKYIRNKSQLYFEKGYGEVLGHSDLEYINKGVNVVSFEDVLTKDIICDAKIGDCNYLSQLGKGQTIFGWIHAVQNKEITDKILNNGLRAIAWEDMYEQGQHSFWRNNEIAGEAGILHAFTFYGKRPSECNVALIGLGNTGRGAYKLLSRLGCSVTVYTRNTELKLRENLEKYDVIVNCILWDTYREDHIIYKEDLKKMKNPSMIVDISCDKNGAIETSIPTTMDNPVYYDENILHYAVDHTPSILYYTVTETLGNEVIKYLDFIIEGVDNEVISKSIIIDNGKIIDTRIIDFQNR